MHNQIKNINVLKMLKYNYSLTELNLTRNKISDINIIEILKYNSSITYLSLSVN